MGSQLDRQDQQLQRHLANKTCVVTGSSRGIGRGIARELGRHQAEVVVNYRKSDMKADSVVDGVEDAGGTAIAVQADVSDVEQVEAMSEQVHDAFGTVDVLVNNAGITRDRRFDELSHSDWNRVLSVCLDGVFNCTKAFFEDIRAADDGRLINISSVVGKQGNYGQANYAAAKSALFGFTRSLALELAPTGSTANCIAPGYTRTDMVEVVREDIQDRIREQIPLGRFAEVEEIAGLVRFLASPESGYMTGEVLNMNGGLQR